MNILDRHDDRQRGKADGSVCGLARTAGAEAPTRDRHQSHFEMRNRSAWPKRATIAHPSVSQFNGTRGCRTNAAPASTVATIGANRATASAASMTIPIPGTLL